MEPPNNPVYKFPHVVIGVILGGSVFGSFRGSGF